MSSIMIKFTPATETYTEIDVVSTCAMCDEPICTYHTTKKLSDDSVVKEWVEGREYYQLCDKTACYKNN